MQFQFCEFPFCGLLLFGDLFYSECHPNTREGERGEPSPSLTLVGVSSLQGRCVTLVAQEPLGAGEVSDWIESETPSPSVDTGLGGSCVSNPHPFVSSSPGLLCCLRALFYLYTGRREKQHQLGTLWDNPWRAPSKI